MTHAGKRMPIDVEPVEGGNIVLSGGLAVVVSTEPTLLDELDPHPGPFYQSHFVTCPTADEHRRDR